MSDDDCIWINEPPVIKFDANGVEVCLKGRKHDFIFRMSRHHYVVAHMSAKPFVDAIEERRDNVRPLRSRRESEG